MEAAPQVEHLKARVIMATSTSHLRTWSVRTNLCNVTTDTITTMVVKVTEVVEVVIKLTATRIARIISALLKVEAAEAEANIEGRITTEVEAAITTIMITEIKEEGVTTVVIAMSMVTIAVGASEAADIMTLIEEGIIIAVKDIHVVAREIMMIGSQ